MWMFGGSSAQEAPPPSAQKAPPPSAAAAKNKKTISKTPQPKSKQPQPQPQQQSILRKYFDFLCCCCKKKKKEPLSKKPQPQSKQPLLKTLQPGQNNKETDFQKKKLQKRVICVSVLDILFGFPGLFTFGIGIIPLVLGSIGLYYVYREKQNLDKGLFLARVGMVFSVLVALAMIIMLGLGISILARVKCEKPVRGLEHMRRGIDATLADLVPPKAGDPRGFRAPIFDFTCNEGRKKILDPNKENGSDLPDQVVSIVTVPGGMKDAKVEVFSSLEAVQSSKTATLGVSLRGVASASGSVSKAHSTLANSTKRLSQITAFVSGFRADLQPERSIELRDVVQSIMYEELTKPFKETPAPYIKFIKDFGTHYFQHASFGGIAQMIIETEKEYFEKMTDSAISAQAKATFKITVSSNATSTNSEQKQEFRDKSSTSLRYFGGLAYMMREGGNFDNWQSTVLDDPWMFRGGLKRITALVRDETIKSELDKAITAHLDHAFLQRQLKVVQSATRKVGARRILTKLSRDIREEIERTQNGTTSHDKVILLGNDVDKHLKIPYWLWDLQICAQWEKLHKDCAYYQSDEEKIAKEICAGVNKWTDRFTDQVETESACYYKWRLKLKGHDQLELPSYFANSGICHQWTNHGTAKNCNGYMSAEDRRIGKKSDANGINCAKIGERRSTQRYADLIETDDGGCDYQWKLATPDDAPMWLQDMKLCFNFYGYVDKWGGSLPDGQTKCGNDDKPATNCALANEWTRAFNDNIEKHRGWCYFYWKLEVTDPGLS